jgi:hypothetical protein
MASSNKHVQYAKEKFDDTVKESVNGNDLYKEMNKIVSKESPWIYDYESQENKTILNIAKILTINKRDYIRQTEKYYKRTYKSDPLTRKLRILERLRGKLDLTNEFII